MHVGVCSSTCVMESLKTRLLSGDECYAFGIINAFWKGQRQHSNKIFFFGTTWISNFQRLTCTHNCTVWVVASYDTFTVILQANKI